MADLIFYAADLDTNQQVVVPQDSMPASPPSGPAGGMLGGDYPNPSVEAVPNSALSADVVLAPAGVLPALNGGALTNLPTAYTHQGSVSAAPATLDGSGQVVLTAGINFPNPDGTSSDTMVMVATGVDTVGILTVTPANIGAGQTFTVTSDAGGTDSGKQIVFMVAYM